MTSTFDQRFAKPSRRSILRGGFAALSTGALAAYTPALAQLSGGTTTGDVKPIVIAIPEFISQDPRLGADLASIVAADLDRSGLFQVLDRRSYIQRIQNFDATPTFRTGARSVRKPSSLAGQRRSATAACRSMSASGMSDWPSPSPANVSSPACRTGAASRIRRLTSPTRK